MSFCWQFRYNKDKNTTKNFENVHDFKSSYKAMSKELQKQTSNAKKYKILHPRILKFIW